MAEEMSQVLSVLDRLEKGQAGIAAGVADVKAKVEQLERGQKQVEQSQKQLEQGQKQLEENQKRLEESHTRLRVDLMDRMDRLQDAYTGMRDDIWVNLGAAEQVREANDNTRAELRALSTVVSGMQKQIHNLQNDVRTLRGDP